jgi:hypothetical protein
VIVLAAVKRVLIFLIKNRKTTCVTPYPKSSIAGDICFTSGMRAATVEHGSRLDEFQNSKDA